MSEQTIHTVFDQRQFEQLFREHFRFLCNFAQQYVHDLDTARDICQKVFIRLWEKRADMDPRQSIKSYLFTSVKNKCLNHLRDQKSYRSRILDVDCGDIDFAREDEDFFAVEELQTRIAAALDKLPEKCREVFEMSRYRDMKYREIADELDISQKTVEAHMRRAMQTLREELQDYLVALLLLGLLS